MVPPKSTLMISYVGYREVRMPLGNRRNVTVEMPEDTEYLDDVVVIGYGTQKKSDLTGSIASVDEDDIKNVPARTMAEALQFMDRSAVRRGYRRRESAGRHRQASFQVLRPRRER